MSEYLRYEKIFSPEQTGNGTRLLRTVRSVKTPFELGRLPAVGPAPCRGLPKNSRIVSARHDRSGTVGRDRAGEPSERLARHFPHIRPKHGNLRRERAGRRQCRHAIALRFRARRRRPRHVAAGRGERHGPERRHERHGRYGRQFHGLHDRHDARILSRQAPGPGIPSSRHVSGDSAQNRRSRATRTPASELYAIAVHTAAEAGLSEYFMGHRQQAGFVGHGIGIEINEMPVLAPRSKEILAEGMVFALEPKFVIPGVGAVGIENSFAVTAGGLEKLTPMDEEIVRWHDSVRKRGLCQTKAKARPARSRFRMT